MRARLIPLLISAAAVSVVADAQRAEPTQKEQGAFADAARANTKYTTTPYRSSGRCEYLVSTAIDDGTVISAAVSDDAGASPPSCTVHALLRPEIQFWLSMPLAWNGRLYMHGNGGAAGQSVHHPAIMPIHARAVRNGFASVYSNSGHVADEAEGTKFLEDAAKRIDFAYRAPHVTIAAARQLVQAFYGRAERHSYWDGCSTGGRQGFMLAQRYPEDFDGILAGAPVFDFVKMNLSQRQVIEGVYRAHLNDDRIALLGRHVLQKCDALDGLKDGVIELPPACRFKPSSDLPRCAGGAKGSDCFSQDELAGLDLIFGDVQVHGKRFFPGVPPGGEQVGAHPGLPVPGAFGQPRLRTGWYNRISLPDETTFSRDKVFMEMRIDSYLQSVGYEYSDLNRNWRQFDLEKDLAAASYWEAAFTYNNPDLTRFHQAGGKFIAHHGWADAGINPRATYEYFQAMDGVMGAKARDVARLFMVPGMYHCRGGYNVDRFDLMTPLIDWVEAGIAPERVVAHGVKGITDSRTRPLCAYPKVARYRGRGSADDAQSFDCVAAP
jgi:Tannase and feruloyl esterase